MKLLVITLPLCAIVFGNPAPKFDGRIVGGEATTIEQFPYQVSVRYRRQHICGGSIIDEFSILTAAHCVYDKDHSEFSVGVGSTNYLTTQNIVVRQVKMNSKYDPIKTDNDVAILILAYKLEFSDQIQVIPLQPAGEEASYNIAADVTGWGVQFQGSDYLPQNLRVARVNVIASTYCQRQYDQLGAKITEHMMCAQAYGKDSCQGDSGGPLTADGKLIGVVSWGAGCARPDYPGVYAKVSNLHSWITANQINAGSQLSMSVVSLVLAIIACINYAWNFN